MKPPKPVASPSLEPRSFDSLGADFETLSAEVRPAVEARLASLWDDKLVALRRHGPEVAAMVSAARELTLRGGKRFRATLLAAAYGGVDPAAPMEHALQGGVALELLQTYLLIQDDWMDGDVTRRGGPSAHVLLGDALGEALGPASAILASDLTWGLAMSVLASIELAPERVVAAIRLFLAVHEDVVVGQQMDVVAHPVSVEAMHALKTGSYTVRGPLALGATLAGAPPETLDALERFAVPVGVAFQLRDDLLGTFGSAAETGKPVGNDLRAGKQTAIVSAAAERLDADGRRAFEEAFGHKDATEAEVAAATEALEACGARGVVERRVWSLTAEAELLANELPLVPGARRVLAGAALALRPPPGSRGKGTAR